MSMSFVQYMARTERTGLDIKNFMLEDLKFFNARESLIMLNSLSHSKAVRASLYRGNKLGGRDVLPQISFHRMRADQGHMRNLTLS